MTKQTITTLYERRPALDIPEVPADHTAGYARWLIYNRRASLDGLLSDLKGQPFSTSEVWQVAGDIYHYFDGDRASGVDRPGVQDEVFDAMDEMIKSSGTSQLFRRLHQAVAADDVWMAYLIATLVEEHWLRDKASNLDASELAVDGGAR